MKFIRRHILLAIVVPGMIFGGTMALAQNNEGGIEVPEPFEETPKGFHGVAILSAVVAANGTLVRGSGVFSATNLAAGDYEVIFKRNVRRCTYIATIGLDGSVGTSPAGTIGTSTPCSWWTRTPSCSAPCRWTT